MNSSNVNADRELEKFDCKWTDFSRRLQREDCVLLDQLAVGTPMKVAAYHAKIPYATARKRVSRWRERLGVESVARLVDAWLQLSGGCHDEVADGATIMMRIGEPAPLVRQASLAGG